MKLKFKLFISLLALTLLLVGCGSSDEKEKSDGGSSDKEMNVNLMVEPPHIDPALTSDNKSGWVLDHIFEGLYTKDEDGEAVLAVAENVELSEDGKTYTFKISENAKWSDGSQVTAEDFEYAWKRVLNPETGSEMAFYLYYLKGAEAYNKGEGSEEGVGVHAEDEMTLVVELEAPLSYFDKMLTYWTYYPVQKELVEDNEDWASNAEVYVGNGPFNLKEWKHDSHIIVEKNEEYHGKDDITLEKITFHMIENATTYYQMFVSNELDLIMELPSEMIGKVKDEDTYTVTPFFGTYMFMFNVEEEPFTNEKIRRAFAMALDREALTESVTRADEIPAFALTPPGVEAPDGDFREVSTHDLEENYDEAKALLEEGLKEEGLTELPEVTLTYNTDENHKKVAEAVQEMFSQNLGVDVKLLNQEWKTFLDTTAQGNFQLARMGWTGIVLDPVVMLDAYLGESPDNETNWINETYDELLDKAKKEIDETKRFEYLQEAEGILMEELPFIPVYFYSKTYLTAETFENVKYYNNAYPNLKWAKKKAE